MKTLASCGLLATLLLATGCTYHVFNEPVAISNKSVVSEHMQPIKQVRATATDYFIVLIPKIADSRDIYDDLLREAANVGGNAVMDVQVRCDLYSVWLLPPIMVNRYEAVGTACKMK